MACSATPLSCLDPVNIFSGIYNPRCGGFADPSNFQAEKAVFGSNFQELINNYGVEVNYYVNGFNLSAMNLLYGEHPTQMYSGPFVIKAYLELEESVSLSQYGMVSEDEVTAYLAIKDFTNLFASNPEVFTENGQRIEPKSDDLMEVTALGCDRPGNRGPKIFRVTEVLDQNASAGLNPVMGHYIWKLTMKRYETSYETNAPMEHGNDQVYDNSFAGKLSSVLCLPSDLNTENEQLLSNENEDVLESDETQTPLLSSDSKIYPFDIDVISQTQVYDMDNTDNSVYGDYY